MALDLVRFTIAALSVYRLAELVSLDDGPYHVFERFRLFLGRKAYISKTHRMLAELVICPFCVGIWMSVPVAVLYLFRNPLFDLILLILGMTGLQAFLEQIGGYNRRS